MFWTILALVLLMVLGGFIAYYGDLTGRRWGKKRVSWFGMRPKHTAILITSLTGAFITIVSIVSLMAVVPPVRGIVSNGETAIRQNRELIRAAKLEKETYVRDAGGLRRQIQDLDEQVRRAQEASAANTHEAEKTKKDLVALRLKRDGLVTQLADKENQVDELNQKLGALELAKRRLTQSIHAMEKTNGEYARQNEQSIRDNIATEKKNKELLASNAELSEGNRNLLTQRDELTRNKSALEEANRRLVEANAADTRRSEDLKNQLKDQIAELTANQTRLAQKYNSSIDQRVDISQSLVALRQGRFSLRAGAELKRRLFDSHLRPSAVRARLLDLLDDANAVALVHRAGAGANGKAIRILNKRFLNLAGQQEDTDENASINALAENVTGSDTPVVVVVNSVFNTVEGEQVVVELSPFAVRSLFDKKDVVASTEIDARQPTDKIFDSLVQFLNQGVRDAALRAGAIPQVDADTGQQRVGSLETRDLLKLTERLRKMGGQVIVTALAAEQMSTADTLHLDFKLSRPQPKPDE